MHSKVKGNIGEAAIVLDLMKQGFPVFTELGDNSKVDLIVLVDNIPVKIQVKCRLIKGNDKIQVDSRKSGPGYSFRYEEQHVDVFAVYLMNQDIVFYLSTKELLKQKATTTFRLERTINQTRSSQRLVRDYTDIRRALRDYTPRTLTIKVEGDDIVQTATEMANES